MRGIFAMMMAVSASGAAVELTNDNFDDLVFNSGKNAFVKFQAPW